MGRQQSQKLTWKNRKIITQKNNLEKSDINNKEIIRPEYVIYLEQTIRLENSNDKEIDRIVFPVQKKLQLFKKKHPKVHITYIKKNLIYNTYIVPFVTYGVQI